MVLAITDSESHSTDPASINAARIAGVHQREQDTMPPATRNFPHRGDCGETLELWEVGIWSDPEQYESCTVSPLSQVFQRFRQIVDS